MGRRDIHDDIKVLRAISPVSVGDNTPQVSQIIDRQKYEGLEFLIATGAIASGAATFAVLVEHGETPTLTDNATVDPTMLLGTIAQAGFTFANPNATTKIGYTGGKRYVRLTITPASNAAAALLACVAVLFSPALAPAV